MKVAMVTPWAVRCGIFTYTSVLSKALAQKNIDVYIIRLNRFGQKTPEILQNLAERIPLDKVDLIHVQHEYGLYQNLEGGFYAALNRLGKPVVTTMHAVGKFEVDRVISNVSKVVVVHNEFCKRIFRLPSVIIPHGCESNKPRARDEAKVALGVHPKIPTVGYVGFISPAKGLEFLIEAMVTTPQAGLLIGGGWHAGPGTEYMTRLKEDSLKRMEGRCQWLGYVKDEHLSTVYGAMDVVVYPSRFATESGALLMALGYGKAVIANRIAPFKEKEKVGALTTFSGVTSLKRKIKRLIRDRKERTNLQKGARAYVETNSWSNIAVKHRSLYHNILKRWKLSKS